MPSTGNGEGRYRVHLSSLIARKLQQIQRRASLEGRGKEVLGAFREILHRLEDNPWDFGEPAPGGDYYKHPVMQLESDRPFRCPHLVGHDCYCGYYLPCDFEKVVQVEPYQVEDWSFSRSVGSSIRLRDELDFIETQLAAAPEEVKAACLQMRTVVDLSCQHGLPISFHG
jgi:hypothetical protein